MKFYRTFSPVKAISFDLDDTLYDNHPFIMEAERKLFRYLGSSYPKTARLSEQDWQTFKREHLTQQPQLVSDMGALRKHTLQTGLHKVGYRERHLSTAVEDCFEYFYYHRSNFKVDKNICSLLSALAEKVPLIAITNGNVNLQQIGIDEYFTHCFKANLSQPMKPHDAMFSKASSVLQLSPKDCLHVGDNLKNDVMGAINAGMQSAWYAINRKMDLRRERTSVLPHIQLDSLDELRLLVDD
ncbi:HAD-IA family hydrolase [Aliiglaciecola lipolytica]|uniref:HAD family hydrolase n=1 Tax=Aliiglaciecola lipolytica E3 TaxID=1127673 RepID=K6YBF4_9ALTE|nr:HAD-IA family hydrolase [Aliiglaciecola lipolytica]GAC15517.1 HAD family hydrolase [Aliiglaciecola lipolytica E3]